MATHKLDIFDLMAAVDKRDSGFLDRQDPDVKKAFTPTVALRWTSAVQGPQAADYLYCTNEFANINYHDLYEYPDLQFKLLTLVGAGKTQRHQWIPVAKQMKTTSAIHAFVSRFYPLANHQEISMIVNKFTLTTFEEFVNSSGSSPEEAKDIISAFKKKTKN